MNKTIKNGEMVKEVTNSIELTKSFIDFVKEKVKIRLYDEEPKELENTLCGGFVGNYGPKSTKYLIENGYFNEDISNFCENNSFSDEFYDYYLDWVTETSKYLRENDEDISSIEDEEERYEVSYDWVDSDGFVFIGFQNYLISLTYDVITELFEEEIENYYGILEELGFGCDYYWEDSSYVTTMVLTGNKYWSGINEEIEVFIQIDLEKNMFEISSINEELVFGKFDDLLTELKKMISDFDEKEKEIEESNVTLLESS
jgi:hypothetical protein